MISNILPATNAATPSIRVRPGRLLLRLPLFYKILVAEVFVVLVASGVSARLAVHLFGAAASGAVYPLLALSMVVSLATIVPVQAAVLRLALAPVDELEYAAERAERGEPGARASLSPLADPRLERLTRVFNRLLERMEADRRRLREIAERAFRAQEAERTRLARELQEETAQTLSAVLIGLRIVRQTADDARRADAIDGLRRDVAAVTERVRQFASGLYTPTLADLGVVAALEGYARALSESSGARIGIEAEDVRGVLAPAGELALYRIVQEALCNAAHHSGASRIRVRVTRGEECIETTVEDDGRGFSVARTESEKLCLGLFGMRERAGYAGGSLRIESKPGEGTRVIVRIPAAERPMLAECVSRVARRAS
ncbi:MAG TPA: sensor histidine kinase [Longimicrobium sp.]|jgi:two-component system sensor histidine kinase UhpB